MLFRFDNSSHQQWRKRSVLIGFEDSIEAIYRNQHPADCSKANYLIMRGWYQGFGSEFHFHGVALAIALDQNV
jgi:hypothetical protein